MAPNTRSRSSNAAAANNSVDDTTHSPSSTSSSSQFISIIIPTYNEAENIPILLWLIEETCAAHSIAYEVVVVDDASPDGTQAAVKQMQQLLGASKIILQPRPAKLGLGTAYIHGLQYARGDWVILMDADFSHHPKYIPTFLAVQQQTGADIVTGTRYQAGGGVYGWNWKRKVTSRGANVLASVLLGLQVCVVCAGVVRCSVGVAGLAYV